jgi:hypothetical protein
MADQATETFQLSTATSLTIASTTEILVLLNRHLPKTFSNEDVYIGLRVTEGQAQSSSDVLSEDQVSQCGVLGEGWLININRCYMKAQNTN